MTTATTALLLYSRCPHVIDQSTGRRCDHPAINPKPRPDVLMPEFDSMRHSVSCVCDHGHRWSVSWSTDWAPTPV